MEEILYLIKVDMPITKSLFILMLIIHIWICINYKEKINKLLFWALLIISPITLITFYFGY